MRVASSMLRDAVVVAALAVLTVQGLRRWVGDRYLVPSGSMEPLLHGHPETGDVVFVGKLAAAGARQRHDLVVVQSPVEAGQQMVKRIACRGDDAECWIDIRQGDVWLGTDAQQMQRETKDPLASQGQRVTWASAPGPAASQGAIEFGPAARAGDGGPWRLPAKEASLGDARSWSTPASREARRRRGEKLLPEGCLGSARPIDAGFVDATGARPATGADVAAHDVGMELTFAADVPLAVDVLATIETRHEALTFHWQPASGRVVLWRDGVDVATTVLPGKVLPTRLQFGLLDDRAFFCLDARRELLFVVPRQPAWNGDPGAGQAPGPRSLVWLTALGGREAGLAIGSLRIFHDVFAWKDPILGMPGQAGGWPRHVPPGHWFLLGDSAFDSRDSRHFGPVAAASFLGLPCCVVGPWPRTRWVRP